MWGSTRAFLILFFLPVFLAYGLFIALPRRVWAFVFGLAPGRGAALVVFPWLLVGILYATASMPDSFVYAILEAGAVRLREAGLSLLSTRSPLVVSGVLCLSGVALSTVFLGPLHVALNAIFLPTKKSDSPSTHGSARFADPRELVAKPRGGPPDGALVLGRLDGKKRRPATLHFGRGHMLTAAPTGAGKGIGCVIPNLLLYPGSVVCLDIKGENYRVTRKRRRQLGQRVFVLDPFAVTGAKSSGFNPLDAIDLASADAVSNAALLAEALVVRKGAALDPHWDEAASQLLAGLMLYVASLPRPERHLGTLRDIVTLRADAFLELLEIMSLDGDLAFGLVARTANGFLAKNERERASVLSTVHRHTAFLDDPRMVELLSKSDFDPRILKARPTTVYLVLPPDRLQNYGRFFRLALGLCLEAMVKDPAQPRHDVLYLLDEFWALGYFARLEEAIAILRGYGVTLWFFVQDLSQLESVYPRWRTFLANTTLLAFGTQDQKTAEFLSKALGTTTVKFETEGRAEGRQHGFHQASRSENASTNVHFTGRPLLMPDEVRRLPESRVIVLARGQRPALLWRLNYLTDPACQGLLSPLETRK